MILISTEDLITKLSALASAREATDVGEAAFWHEDTELAWAARDGMEALMSLARDLEIGWYLNAGLRCDVDFDLAHVDATDNSNRWSHDGSEPRGAEVTAATPQGALAGAILAILYQRQAAKP